MASERSVPTIDVIIPALNEARYLGACLESLAAQRYALGAVTVFVVDNGSTDATISIAEGFKANGLHVRVLRQARRGPAASRNTAIREGQGELLALLDGHCIVEPAWLGTLAGRFASPQLGGCQATIVSRATSPRVQRYLDTSGEQSNARILDDTVLGKRNLYPWILSGNSMYRRAVVEAVGGFDEELRACEDVDLAWRVVLAGYQLAHEPKAVAVHYDTNTWWRFVRKGLAYGAGAAELTRRYEQHGAKNKFTPTTVWSASLDRSLSSLFYGTGYRLKAVRMRLGIDRSPREHAPASVATEFRPWFTWTGNSRMRIGERTVYWLRDGSTPESVVVHVPTRTRLVLDGPANDIWRYLADGRSREEAAASLSAYYGISPITAESDIDDFIEELVEGGYVTREQAMREH
jgi:glycosyltransferase involved in cell wall biosynthesis